MKLETLCLHAGQELDPSSLSCGQPVYRTAAYHFKSTAHAADLFAVKEVGNIYTRLTNPTHDLLEKRVAAMEGGAAALVLASGMSAIFNTVINICRAGDEIVSAANLYGGSFTMFNDILPQFGIKTHFVEPLQLDSFKRALTPKTKLIYVETLGNPALDMIDLESVAAVAAEHGVPLVVDSTFTTPYLLRPIEYGASIVVHSMTKWLGGHGSALGGVVVDSGRFDWSRGDFPLFNEPEPSYHDLRFAHDFGELSKLAFIVRMRLVPLRNLGACLSPDNAWIILQGIETLPLRMQRHCQNAMAVAEFLKAHAQVAWVRYPGLESDPAFATAQKYLKRGFGGMVVFGIKGGRQAGVRWIESLKLFSHVANVGDAKSLAIHPASTTHAQLSAEQQRLGGISPDLIRLSIGIEHIDDIISDLEQAFAALQA
ncbi:MAG: O-acetylhomoserine aminocarboxypropyltransferase/cysteine synthase [Deltaproteobacteria bacterium]|nr:O-acetylhomoserine aminocarboxypropyltransferase/cysteine synthase [Deltaproteobacteria bacterium]